MKITEKILCKIVITWCLMVALFCIVILLTQCQKMVVTIDSPMDKDTQGLVIKTVVEDDEYFNKLKKEKGK
ncbi:MAG: hypothetical protein DRJ03_02420 [Chloroflexi bacterium]|nr:MAG: hypothetical protein DRJ03_02420 [Chloroflexota bacterium]